VALYIGNPTVHSHLAGLGSQAPGLALGTRVALAVGIEPEVVRRLARDFASARSACAYCRVGTCQSEFGPLTCWLVEAMVVDVPRLDRWVDAGRAPPVATTLVLVGRRHLRSNNSWVHNLRSLVKGPDRATLMMHPLDAERLGLIDGARVRVSSRTGQITAPLSVSDQMIPGVVSFPHGHGHARLGDAAAVASGLPGQSANDLTDELLVEPLVGTSILNGVAVTMGEA
jgi:anaerobic selenocysteine-containing dehydrogenase